MGTFKKEAARRKRVRDSSAPSELHDGNLRVKGENFYRDAKKVKQVNMYRGGKAIRDRDGKIIKEAVYQSTKVEPGRVQPDKRWFNSTRVISQSALSEFRERVSKTTENPYEILLKRNKLPMSLLNVEERSAKTNIIASEPYEQTFGAKAQRKRPRLQFESMEELGRSAQQDSETFENTNDLNNYGNGGDADNNNDDDDSQYLSNFKEPIFNKGQSKRIWNELYKVIDSSDVIIHVLDARNPLGTRCRSVEKYLKNEAPHKHLIFVLNKCDLVPNSVAASWVRLLSKERPTLAFHASISNSFGKGSLIQLLRQYSTLLKDKKQISVGLIGYPNTGKSSIINTLRKKKVCNVAPIPGETKVWQYITLMRRIYLIDCPGIVPPNQSDTNADIMFKGVVRVENVEHPEQYIPELLERCKPKYLAKTYGIEKWEDATDFMAQLAKKYGRLIKGGAADENTISKMIINDFIRGKIPWFVPPPKPETESIEEDESNVEADANADAENQETCLDSHASLMQLNAETLQKKTVLIK